MPNRLRTENTHAMPVGAGLTCAAAGHVARLLFVTAALALSVGCAGGGGTGSADAGDRSGRDLIPCVDDDNDGTCNEIDRCPGFSDAIDIDGDGEPDGCDECPTSPTGDSDGDGICDDADTCVGGDDAVDADDDGLPDACDDCPLDPENDSDRDGFCAGDDVCPEGDDTLDTDGDGRPNACDACPLDNPNDSDGDGVCDSDDLCEGDDALDTDGDGDADCIDACPLDSPDDTDGDGVCDSVDICDGDDAQDGDSDGVPDACDVCPAGDDALDADEDGLADACDVCPIDSPDDSDGDGVCDSDDLCEGFDDTVDDDGDGVPDGCDFCGGGSDTDGDGVCDSDDACPLDRLDDQDGDGACDSDDPCPLDSPDDTDGDSVCESLDVCPGFDDSLDADGDGEPDGCDRCAGGPGGDDDEDGVCDGDDVCAGGDDTIDADGDGTPDDCDLCDGDDALDADDDGVCDADDVCPGFDDAGPDADGDGIVDACEPARGSYQYDRAELGGLGHIGDIALSLDGDYALLTERFNELHVLDIATGVLVSHSFAVPGESRYIEEVAFSPLGDIAIAVGYAIDDGDYRGVLYRWNDAVWRETGDPSLAWEELTGMAFREVYEDIEFTVNTSAEGGVRTASAMILSRRGRSAYNMWLDALDTSSGETTLLASSPTSIGCQDIAPATNEFGNPGFVIVCGLNGYDGFYYTEVGGVWELREDLGNNLLGNTSSLVPRPQGDYTLALSSSDRVHRFQDGLMGSNTSAPLFRTRRLNHGAFSPDGVRALFIGQYQNVSGSEIAGVFEYRHDDYDCPAPLTADCDITDVSISNFGGAPYIATNGTNLEAIVWRRDCDGGYIVGGKSNISTNTGLVIEFQREGGRDCGW